MALGGSQTVRSFISLPRKMMYSNTSSRGGIGLSVGRSSVPKDRTVKKIRDNLNIKQASKDTNFYSNNTKCIGHVIMYFFL